MECVINPYRELSANIAPEEFELFCLKTLEAYAEKESLKQFAIKHNQKIKAYDSTYQIDILAEYTALGCKHTVVVECKKHTRSVERSVVAELYAKINSIGANKGILISTSGFQSDAVKYAKAHGIALWQICDRTIKHIMASANRIISPAKMFEFEVERYLPQHFMIEWDCEADYPYSELFPTKEMYAFAQEKARKQIMQEKSHV